MRRFVPAALAVLLALGLAGCASGNTDVGLRPANIDVNTPQLRALKAQAGVENCRPGTGAPVDGGLPKVTLPCLGGGPSVDLASLRGPMVVNLWASWCGSCRREMPVLEAFHQKYGKRVAVLGVDYQDPQTVPALGLVRDTKVTYPLLADPQSALDGAAPFPSLRGLPFLAFVDKDGRVVHQEFVALKSEDQLVGLVNQYLGAGL